MWNISINLILIIQNICFIFLSSLCEFYQQLVFCWWIRNIEFFVYFCQSFDVFLQLVIFLHIKNSLLFKFFNSLNIQKTIRIFKWSLSSLLFFFSYIHILTFCSFLILKFFYSRPIKSNFLIFTYLSDIIID